MKRLIYLFVIAALVGAGAAAANATRVTKGDAESVLNAFGNGGWAIQNHSKTLKGAPSQGLPGLVAIRPFSGTPFNGAHYCALDFHTIVIADIEYGPEKAASAAIDALDVSMTLDGAALALTQTPVKRFLGDGGSADEFYSQYGRVMAPADLALGAHSLSVVETYPAGPIPTGSCSTSTRRALACAGRPKWRPRRHAAGGAVRPTALCNAGRESATLVK